MRCSWAGTSLQEACRSQQTPAGPCAVCCADFVRLIQDPAATQIELKGDIVFTHDYFPPANAHDQSKGINITHKVTGQGPRGRWATVYTGPQLQRKAAATASGSCSSMRLLLAATCTSQQLLATFTRPSSARCQLPCSTSPAAGGESGVSCRVSALVVWPTPPAAAALFLLRRMMPCCQL